MGQARTVRGILRLKQKHLWCKTDQYQESCKGPPSLDHGTGYRITGLL